MALHPQDAFAIADLAVQIERVIVIPHSWNYATFVQADKEWIETGVLGAVEYVLFRWPHRPRLFFRLSARIFPTYYCRTGPFDVAGGSTRRRLRARPD